MSRTVGGRVGGWRSARGRPCSNLGTIPFRAQGAMCFHQELIDLCIPSEGSITKYWGWQIVYIAQQLHDGCRRPLTSASHNQQH
jgi:hypothetical protein